LTTTINKNEGDGFPSTVIAAKALQKSIEFADSNFKVPQERDFIMTKIFEGLEC